MTWTVGPGPMQHQTKQTRNDKVENENEIEPYEFHVREFFVRSCADLIYLSDFPNLHVTS